jgi:Zn-dependent M16 (insulinase) family peptidase
MHPAQPIHNNIIAGAHKARYTVAEDDTKKQAISISEAWMAELQKHPYHSSKLLLLILVEKPDTEIFLMKKSAKLHRPQKEREKKKLAKRLWTPSELSNDDKKEVGQRINDKTWEEDNSQRCSHPSKETHR